MTWALFVTPLALLLIGTPIFVVVLATAAVATLWFLNVPATMIHQVMFGSLDQWALIALPFFIFAGMLMGQGGMSKRIVDWAMSLVGGFRGGLGLTAVASFTLFGSMSGSAPATVGALGRLLYTPLRDGGYSERFSVGLIISTGGIATLIPPSITMILYGAAAQQSVAHLFIAGLLPGLLIVLLLSLYVVVFAHRHRVGQLSRPSMERILSTTKSGAAALGAPVIVLGGIYTGVFSPTEAGGIAALYALGIAVFVYREMPLRRLWRVASDSMYITAQVLIIVAATGVYSWMLTVSGVPELIVGFLQGITDERWVVLMLINAFLLLVGCFIDPASAILILTPLLVPVVLAYDVDLVHFGVIMAVNLEIAMFTPPMGLNIFMAQALFRTPLRTIYSGLGPFFLINILALMIVTFVPDISLVLVRMMG